MTLCIVCGGRGLEEHHVLPQSVVKKSPNLSVADWTKVSICVMCHHRDYHCDFEQKRKGEELQTKSDYVQKFLEFMDWKRDKDGITLLDAKEIEDPEKRLEAEKHICYLRANRNKPLHNQIQKSLKKLNKLGLSQEKIRKIKSWFQSNQR